ncbi:MAG: bifunctional riboflavin kinase/FAD synthetase [Armatimonadetes bacterium]|nr:bifunctional riboflavin kinase/FAD synthetase [Armatimonadota bacterium]
MRVFRRLEEIDPPPEVGSVVSIGVFDGVHLGHQKVIGECRRSAAELEAESFIVTFDRHPLETIAPERAPLRIATLEDRLDWIAETGADAVLVLPFDRRTADMTAESFLEDVLCRRLAMRRIVAGTRFHFGKDRRGDLDYLEARRAGLGFDVLSVAPLLEDGLPVSSTRIRALLAEGQIEEADRLLTRPFRLHGTVARGRQLGRTIGFPTANLAALPRQALPGRGVYVTETLARGQKRRSVTNVGYRPTVSDERILTVETHIAGFQDMLYDEAITLFFLRRLRDERKFSSLEALISQLREDVESALRSEAVQDPGAGR